MRVHVRYFQNVRKSTGIAEEFLELAEKTSVGDLIVELVKKYPDLGPSVPSLLFAINETHARRVDLLTDGDILAVMPPFSGG